MNNNKTILFRKNDGMVGELEAGNALTITGSYLSKDAAISGVNIELGVDTKGGIYLINHDDATTALFVRELKLRAGQSWYLNAPQMDRIEIATGPGGSFFLHSRQLTATDRAEIGVGDDVTHELWITDDENRGMRPPRY